VQNEVRKYMNN